MTNGGSNDTLDLLLNSVEQEILLAPDRDLLEAEALKGIGLTAQDIVGRALAVRQRRTPRQALRGAQRTSSDRRAIIRQLLVANPRARELTDMSRLETLSDADVEAMLKRFAEMGLLPPDRS